MFRRLVRHAVRGKRYYWPPLNAAILLSGAGHLDGTEVVETVGCTYMMGKKWVNCHYFSLDKPEVIDPTRNMLEESQRIVRGPVNDVSELAVDEYDLLIIPGGEAILSNFCDFDQTRSENFTIESHILSVIEGFHAQNKPIAACNVAPILLAKTIPGVNITLGDRTDSAVMQVGYGLGADIDIVPPEECVLDKKQMVVTTPTFASRGVNPWTIFKGTKQMCKEVVRLARGRLKGKKGFGLGTSPRNTWGSREF